MFGSYDEYLSPSSECDLKQTIKKPSLNLQLLAVKVVSGFLVLTDANGAVYFST